MAKKKDEAKIRFTAETGEFNDEIRASESTLRELRSELKLNASQMKKTGDNTETLRKRQAILGQEMDAAKAKTEALRKKLEKAREIFGDNSEEVSRLKTQLNNAETAEKKIADEIEATNKALKAQKTKFDEVGEAAGKVGDKLTDAGKKMSVVSAGIAAAGAASIAAFNEVDEGADNVIKATGATGKAAEELEAVYSSVAQQVVGDFGSLGSAVGEINTRFGYTGKELERASLTFQKFGEVTGMDTTAAVQAVSRALNDAGIPLDEYDSLLDQLAKAGQAAGIDVSKLAESLSTNGAVMRGMGFNTEETIALLSQFEVSGADASTMLTGMKKAMANWAKEGKNGNDEFAKTVEGIKNGSIDASDALEIFGTRAGPLLVDAIKTGKFEYQDMLKTIEGSKGAVDSTFEGTVDGGYEMELAMQNAKVALAEVGDTLATTLTPFVQQATKAMQGFADWWGGLSQGTQTTIFGILGVVAAIGPVLVILGTVAKSIQAITTVVNLLRTSTLLATVATKLQTAAQWLLNAAMNANPISLIILAVVALIAIFAVLWNKCDGFRQFWVKMWEGIKKAFTSVVNWIKENWVAMLLFIVNPVAGVFKYLWDNCEGFRNIVQKVVTAVKNFFVNLWQKIKDTFSNVKGWFSEKFNAAKTAVVKAFSAIPDFFRNTVTKIKNTFAKVKDAILSPFRTAIDKVKALFNKLKLKFPGIKLPHFSVTPKGWKAGDLLKGSIPKLSIDWYAKGAIFTKPTILSTPSGLKGVGDVRGGEGVLPIDLLRGYIAEAIAANTPTVDVQTLAKAIEHLAGRPIDLSINGRAFAEAIAGDSDSVNGLRTNYTERGLVLA